MCKGFKKIQLCCFLQFSSTSFLKSFDCCKLQIILVVSFISAKEFLLGIYSAFFFVKFHSVFLLKHEAKQLTLTLDNIWISSQVIIQCFLNDVITKLAASKNKILINILEHD